MHLQIPNLELENLKNGSILNIKQFISIMFMDQDKFQRVWWTSLHYFKIVLNNKTSVVNSNNQDDSHMFKIL